MRRLILVAALFVLLFAVSPGGRARAAGPADARAPMLLRGLTLGSEPGDHSTVTLSAKLTSSGGTPAQAEPVVFYEVSTVFGERLENLGSAMTDASGAASLPYQPTWPGTHTIVARFAGDRGDAPAQSTFRFDTTAPAHVHQNAKFGLAGPRKYAPFGVGLAVLAVWGALLFALLRTMRGIMVEAPLAAEGAAPTPARTPLTPTSVSPMLAILAVLAVAALFVGYVLPSSKAPEPTLAGPPNAGTGSHAVTVADHTFGAQITQTVPAFLTDDEGKITPNSPNLPAGVTFMDGKTFVLDTNAGRILTVTPDGQLARIFESDPDGQTSVARATAMASRAHEIYVAAPLYGNVLEISAAGHVDSVIQPELPNAPRPFLPAGVAVTDSGDIWLSDANNHRVVLVDKSGSVVATIGGGPAAAGENEFETPAGLTVDSRGNLWVADAGLHEVREYAPGGTFITSVGQNALATPQDVAVDDSGRLFVTDLGLREVRVFGADGSFLGSIGKAESTSAGGPSDAGLQDPHGLEIHGDQLYVMDRLSGMFVFQVGAR